MHANRSRMGHTSRATAVDGEGSNDHREALAAGEPFGAFMESGVLPAVRRRLLNPSMTSSTTASDRRSQQTWV